MIHIIEDEPHHAILLDRALCQARFATTLAADGHTGWENVQRLMPSLILLDLMLPGMDGQEVCRLVRSTPSTRHIPIIMLSALGTEEDRISGIQMGADDYVVKPFSPREVVSRVQAVLRRSQELVSAATALSDASITVQGPYFVVSLEGRQLTVSSMELALLRAILPREGELVRAEELTALLVGENQRIPLEELDHRIRFLRRKLENSGAGTIEILPGFRYRLPTAL